MKTPEIEFLEAMIRTARALRGAPNAEVAMLALKEEQALLRRLEKAMEKAKSDHPQAGATLAEVAA